jgi:hypothetical protein
MPKLDCAKYLRTNDLEEVALSEQVDFLCDHASEYLRESLIKNKTFTEEQADNLEIEVSLENEEQQGEIFAFTISFKLTMFDENENGNDAETLNPPKIFHIKDGDDPTQFIKDFEDEVVLFQKQIEKISKTTDADWTDI